MAHAQRVPERGHTLGGRIDRDEFPTTCSSSVSEMEFVKEKCIYAVSKKRLCFTCEQACREYKEVKNVRLFAMLVDMQNSAAIFRFGTRDPWFIAREEKTRAPMLNKLG